MRAALAIGVLGLVLGGCGRTARTGRLEVTMAVASGGARRFPVVIETPAGFDAGRGRAVFLFGGGLQTDEDWAVPGMVGRGEGRARLTLDGAGMRDAAALSRALVERGCAVVRYGSIHLNDAAYAAYPWACGGLAGAGVLVLAVWGGLDPTSYHGPVLAHVFDAAGAGAMLTTRWYPGLGHQLGAERGGLVGPMDPGVIDAIAVWIAGLE